MSADRETPPPIVCPATGLNCYLLLCVGAGDCQEWESERQETCFTCGAWEDEVCPRRPCEYLPHSKKPAAMAAQSVMPDAPATTNVPTGKA